ncbi:hypothetical protein DP113_25375 [Brasilonema octagenarum UFV-E1]|uniref:Uncharacterized protein n=2 Tax=Brasilonema TaxID=383614 RepID=A0A856MNI3_9CYAN|nr:MULTISPECIES: hypothetical protein [Brasilonema]NMF66623.1 hypothetical protein [Brasilonema octagenarum UFV-OR1]QDL10807.1 hypothetical protein DP114_25465 [Brasilonema sennae CENA114]QDL17153.1 hypothetical protein DP113_25375 [Brasilonema octagenarum UFV-E1]
MASPTKYWQMQILPIGKDVHLKHHREISKAKEFLKTQFPHLSNKPTLSTEENKQVQTVLWNIFRLDDDIYQRAIAGLCLRCYVSHRILITCKTIPHIYNVSAENLFKYTDLLPFVLNDDGKALVILDSEGKTQYILNNHDGTTRPIAKGGKFFSVDILRSFNPNLGSNESLDNWIHRLTRQNEEIKSFLWEFGLATPSDWGLLCKSVTRSLSGLLSTEDYEIVKAFKTVYQRDRLKKRQKGRCSEPTPSQLQEMLYLLQQKNLIISQNTLIYHLKHIAESLRQDWLYKKTGSTKTVPMEVYDNSTNDYFPNPELPYHTDREPEDVEFERLQEICKDLFEQVLYETIGEVIHQRIEDLKKSKGYKNFAQRLPEGLRLYYQESISLSEIGKHWGIEWSKARRIMQLENFLEIVQYRTEEIFLEKLLQSLNQSQSTRISQEPESLKNIVAEIRDFAWNQTFKQAKAELLSGKKQSKNSLFAKQICVYLSDSSYAA